MTKFAARFVLATSVLIAFASLARADDDALPKVTVYGTATTEVTPDLMNWHLTITNKGKDLAPVADNHHRIVAGVLKLLKDSGIDEQKIQTARMAFGENWVYRSNNRVKEGYYASTSVSFEMSDFDLYRTLWSGLAQDEHVSIDYVGYDHSKRIDYQNETRIKALLAAKEKAKALAETLGSQIGEPLLIEEDAGSQSMYPVPTFSNNLRTVESADGGSEGIAKGKIPIKIRIKASFRLITQG
ncbi:MAG TPA: SIMPL domain-containing protein [Phycisphaerae bacterium]|nr:SIMPL domain-containing protein [Phycisphaerae bacterium]